MSTKALTKKAEKKPGVDGRGAMDGNHCEVCGTPCQEGFDGGRRWFICMNPACPAPTHAYVDEGPPASAMSPEAAHKLLQSVQSLLAQLPAQPNNNLSSRLYNLLQ